MWRKKNRNGRHGERNGAHESDVVTREISLDEIDEILERATAQEDERFALTEGQEKTLERAASA